MAVLAFLRTHWRTLAMLLLLLIAYLQGSAHKDAQWEAKWQKHVAEDATNVARAATAARKQEADWAAAFDAAATIQNQEMRDVQAHRDRLLADLRSGRLSFKPARCPVPQAPADPGQPESRAEGGQSGLVGEAITNRFAVCDEVVIERNQAVRLLEVERGQVSTP